MELGGNLVGVGTNSDLMREAGWAIDGSEAPNESGRGGIRGGG